MGIGYISLSEILQYIQYFKPPDDEQYAIQIIQAMDAEFVSLNQPKT